MCKYKSLMEAKMAFRKKGLTLFADKQKAGGGGSWKFASEDNLVKTISPALYDCGLEIFSEMLFKDGSQFVSVTLSHEAGEARSSQVFLSPITPKKDKNGNSLYLDAEIEQGKRFGYWSRILTMRLLGLSDVESPEFMNSPILSDDELKELDKARESLLAEVVSLSKGNDKKEAYLLKISKTEKLEDITTANINDNTVKEIYKVWSKKDV